MSVSNAQENVKQRNCKTQEDSGGGVACDKDSRSQDCMRKEIELTCIDHGSELSIKGRPKRKVNFVGLKNKEKVKKSTSEKILVVEKEGRSLPDPCRSSEELFFIMKLEGGNPEETTAFLEKIGEVSGFTSSGREKVYKFLMKAVCSSPIKPREETYYFCDRDRIPDQKSPSFAFFGRAFNILEKMLMKESKKLENMQLLGLADIQRCLNLLRSEDLRIRTLTKKFIQEVYSKHTKSRHCIKLGLKNILINIVHEQREPVGINELLSLSTYMLVSDGFAGSLEAECYFSECIFPILKISNSHLYEQELKTAFEAFSQLGNECLLYTFKQMSRIFFDVNSNVRISILNFCLSIVQVKQATMDFRHVEDYVCSIISTCLKNAHCILISHVLTFIKEKTMYGFLRENCITFIPKIFDDVYNLSRSYWNKDRSPEIYSIMTIIMSLNKDVFEECLKRYNFKKYKQKMENDVSEDVIRYFGQDFLRENEGVVGVRRKSLPHEKRMHDKSAF